MSMRQYNNFIKYINSVLPTADLYNFKNKESCLSDHIAYMLNRTHKMFKWSNLPETINVRCLELFLQVNGHIAFFKHNDTLYFSTGGLGGEPSPYYMPTLYTISNPSLNISKSFEIDKDCVVVNNDTLYIGLIPLLRQYGTLTIENLTTLRIGLINSRIVDLLSASDDSTRESAIKYLEDIEDGKLGVIADKPFLESIKVQPYGRNGTTGNLTNIIESLQYIKASEFNELGLNSNYNMKRESINSNESQLNKDALLPLVDDMLECRKEAVEKINNMFGTNIAVELASSWEDIQEEVDNSVQTENNEGVSDEQNTEETS